MTLVSARGGTRMSPWLSVRGFLHNTVLFLGTWPWNLPKAQWYGNEIVYKCCQNLLLQIFFIAATWYYKALIVKSTTTYFRNGESTSKSQNINQSRINMQFYNFYK